MLTYQGITTKFMVTDAHVQKVETGMEALSGIIITRVEQSNADSIGAKHA